MAAILLVWHRYGYTCKQPACVIKTMVCCIVAMGALCEHMSCHMNKDFLSEHERNWHIWIDLGVPMVACYNLWFYVCLIFMSPRVTRGCRSMCRVGTAGPGVCMYIWPWCLYPVLHSFMVILSSLITISYMYMLFVWAGQMASSGFFARGEDACDSTDNVYPVWYICLYLCA